MPVLFDRVLVFLFVGMFGSIFGSFANVVILRWHESASLLGRSACPSCKRTLQPRHLVPLFSWIWQKGRCAFCRKRIHVQYPLVELLAVVFAVIAAVRHFPLSDPAAFAFEFFFSLSLLVPIVMDLRWQELPVEYLVGVGVVGFVCRSMIAGAWPTLWDAFGLLVPIVFFGSQYVFSKGRLLGEGDVWFGGMMGAVLGWPNVGIAIYLAYLFGGIAALVGLGFKLVRRGSRIPFAPALAAGTLSALWLGDRLVYAIKGW